MSYILYIIIKTYKLKNIDIKDIWITNIKKNQIWIWKNFRLKKLKLFCKIKKISYIKKYIKTKKFRKVSIFL